MFWTKLHVMTVIPVFLVMFIIACFFARIFRKDDDFIKLLPIRIIAIILVFLEVVKQVLSIKNGYSTHHLPFHFCSLFVFLFPIFAFYNGKKKEHVRSLTLLSCMMLFVFMLFGPNTIYSDVSISEFFSDFFSFHTVFFHNIVIFGFFYIVAMGLYNIDTKRDYKTFFIGYSGYSAFACVMSQVLKENFNSFYTCKFEPLEKVRLYLIDKIDWVGQMVYVLSMYLVTLLFALFCYWLFRWSMILVRKIVGQVKKER